MKEEIHVDYQRLLDYKSAMEKLFTATLLTIQDIEELYYSIFSGEDLCWTGQKSKYIYEAIKSYWKYGMLTYVSNEVVTQTSVISNIKEAVDNYIALLDSAVENYKDADKKTLGEEKQEDQKEKSKEKSYENPVKTPGEYLANKKTSDGYGPAFLEKTKEVADKHGIDYKELLALMNQESSIDTTSKNGQYVGLVQIGNDGAAELGYTTSEILNMSPLEQLDVVDKRLTTLEKYLPEGKHTAADYYSANFMPANAKKEVLMDDSNKYWAENKGFDSNGDGKITKSEMQDRINLRKVDESSFTD